MKRDMGGYAPTSRCKISCRTITTQGKRLGARSACFKVRRNPVPIDHNPGATHEMTGKAGDLQPYAGDSIAILGGRPLQANSGIPLDLNWVQEVRANTSAVERRAQTQVARRTVKKEWQAAWLLRAVSCMDLTTLSGHDSSEEHTS